MKKAFSKVTARCIASSLWLIAAAPAVLANYCAMGWLLGLSRGRALLALAAVANGVNIGLDYLFIYELGWGAVGAGWATTMVPASAASAATAMSPLRIGLSPCCGRVGQPHIGSAPACFL